jgi:hypothetical protein
MLAGLFVKTSQGPLGAVGFTVTGGLITAIDLTVDPERLEGADHTGDARQPDPPHGRVRGNHERVQAKRNLGA